MKCRSCGYVSFDRLENCKRCGAPRNVTAAGIAFSAPPAEPPTAHGDHDFPDDLQDLRFSPASMAPAGPGRDPERDDRDADIEALVAKTVELDATDPDWPRDALDLEPLPDTPEAPVFYIADDLNLPGLDPEAPGSVQTRPAFVIAAGEPPGDSDAGPIIDRDDEIPEQYWATEVAGLGRRVAALCIDNVILAAIVGLFFGSAFLALALSGFDAAFLLTPAGIWAVARPFVLLAALLGLAYHVLFHGWLCATPGQSLLGLEVRSADGQVPSWRRTFLRGCAATLGLACAGVGIAWALFEPRRRGWADLLSGTVVTECRRDPSLTTPGGAGTIRAL